MPILLGMTNEDVNITTREVASLARVDASTVRRWVEKRILTPSMVTPGGRYRFARADVLGLLSPTSPVDSAPEAVSAGDSSSAADAA